MGSSEMPSWMFEVLNVLSQKPAHLPLRECEAFSPRVVRSPPSRAMVS